MSCVCIVNVFFSLFENRKGKKRKAVGLSFFVFFWWLIFVILSARWVTRWWAASWSQCIATHSAGGWLAVLWVGKAEELNCSGATAIHFSLVQLQSPAPVAASSSTSKAICPASDLLTLYHLVPRHLVWDQPVSQKRFHSFSYILNLFFLTSRH